MGRRDGRVGLGRRWGRGQLGPWPLGSAGLGTALRRWKDGQGPEDRTPEGEEVNVDMVKPNRVMDCARSATARPGWRGDGPQRNR